jgi:hypothetical protein
MTKMKNVNIYRIPVDPKTIGPALKTMAKRCAEMLEEEKEVKDNGLQKQRRCNEKSTRTL